MVSATLFMPIYSKRLYNYRMRIAYQYKLLPTIEEKAQLSRWLDRLRYEYNWLLAERFSWWEQNRCDVNACPLVCYLPQLRDNPEYYGQKRSLVQLKQDRPWYQEIYADVLQDCVKRVKLSFDRFLKGDSQGHRSGRPRFKAKHRYRTFSYPRIKPECINGNRITLPKLGAIKLIGHRPLPDGFTIKTASVTCKADGWYVTLSLDDQTVPELINPVEPAWDNSIGIDLGLEKFLADSQGEFEPIPQHLGKSEEKLAKLQQKVSAAKKGSRARKLLILNKADVVFVEDLSVKNLSRRCQPKQDETGKFLPNGQAAKSGMNKSIADAGWSQFIDTLTFKAERAGAKVVKVDPKGTSQHCCVCLNWVPKELSQRWHSCPHCANEMDRDTNAAILIKKVGLGIASLKNARRTSVSREAHTIADQGLVWEYVT
jgi:putative transposase